MLENPTALLRLYNIEQPVFQWYKCGPGEPLAVQYSFHVKTRKIKLEFQGYFCPMDKTSLLLNCLEGNPPCLYKKVFIKHSILCLMKDSASYRQVIMSKWLTNCNRAIGQQKFIKGRLTLI